MCVCVQVFSAFLYSNKTFQSNFKFLEKFKRLRIRHMCFKKFPNRWLTFSENWSYYKASVINCPVMALGWQMGHWILRKAKKTATHIWIIDFWPEKLCVTLGKIASVTRIVSNEYLSWTKICYRSKPQSDTIKFPKKIL